MSKCDVKINFYFSYSKENLVDRDGLLAYVARKIGVGNVCIMCNESGKAFYSLAAVRQHMISKFSFNLKNILNNIIKINLTVD